MGAGEGHATTEQLGMWQERTDSETDCDIYLPKELLKSGNMATHDTEVRQGKKCHQMR